MRYAKVLLILLFFLLGVCGFTRAERKAYWYLGVYGNSDKSVSYLVSKVKNKNVTGLYRDADGWILVAVYPPTRFQWNLLNRIDTSSDILKPYSQEGRFGYIDDSTWQALLGSHTTGIKVYIRHVNSPYNSHESYDLVLIWPKTNRMSCKSYLNVTSLNPSTWPVEGPGTSTFFRDEDSGCVNGGMDYSVMSFLYPSGNTYISGRFGVYNLSSYNWIGWPSDAGPDKSLYATDDAWIEIYIK